MTALIIISFTYAFNSQPQAEQVTENVIVTSENVTMNAEQTTAVVMTEKESTAAFETQQTVGENRETTTKSVERDNQPNDGITDKADKVVNSDKAGQIKNEKPAIETITVMFSINCENAVDYGYDIAPYLLQNETYTAEQGATVFDVLKALCDENGISLKYQRKTYIQGIGGLNEKDCGGSSGWTYRVNGELITKPASSYILKNGDVVEWRYITNSNE